ncbi:MAG: PAS domain S-box protein [Gammaproteobacteria bacterium]|jgi:PAS domain S-box-containing protein|nr:PAS domain S-box protein [Gammaproteobacteria bacterium]MBT3735743.1 PAS domain S-box protein [Gammaproteobacteria bacterium]MBT7541304.1 PAS domain S-box protein [Gammaproteobacteria bacterium]
MKYHLIPSSILIVALIGLPYIFVGWSLAIYSAKLPWALSSIVSIHEINYLIFLFDMVPVLLGLVLILVFRVYFKEKDDDNLFAQESILKSVLERMADGFVTISEEGIILSANTAIEKMFGYPEKEIVGKNVNILMPDAYASNHNAIISRLRTFGVQGMAGKSGREVEGKKRDGTIFSLSITVSEMYLKGRRKFNGVVRDVTDVKQAQAEALRTADELTLFVDTANAPIFGIDSGGLVNEWNQASEKITGFTKVEVLGKDLVSEFITDEYKAPVKQVLDNALHGNETANYEFPLYTKTSQRVDVLLNATTRRDVDGVITGVIGVGQDITELRQKQAALNQASKMESVGQLTGGIAHDFNNLLSVIDGNLRFLQQDIGNVSDDITELFDDAMSAATDAAELTARLLAFSRNRGLKPELKNANEAIDNFSRFLSRTLGKANELQTELSEEALYIMVDTAQLENALLNLAINARDAMADGGNITLRSERYHCSERADLKENNQAGIMLNPGDYVVVSVEDTGAGIEQEDLVRVFEPFFTTKEIGKGGGLGLSMVYGFVQQSSGQCVVRSKIGEGTKVSMYFPEAQYMEQDKSSIDEKKIAFADSEVILVVEDEPRVLKVTSRDLKRLGYRTLEANNASMAKTMIDSGQKIDLVFSDVLMPGDIDGQMLGLWIEKNHPLIKVVLTSGFTKRKTEVGENESSFPLLRKPYTIEALAKKVSMALFENR